MSLKSYEAMKDKEGFSEQLLGQCLAGLSGRRYRETVVGAAEALGVSPSAISERLVEATTHKLKEFRERRLEDFAPFAVFLDTVHRGGRASWWLWAWTPAARSGRWASGKGPPRTPKSARSSWRIWSAGASHEPPSARREPL